ncbi:hypothetical protein ILUMI_00907 [Ignelater luminosus]|uniref:Methyltransferase NSUN7 n=1 Tax=Ignelater luminosus TaxID=2038154 RepID=A0A8K0DKZ7_IGNLU|nr:hypothetical protein ILUMI_00907 [Ignelater luminosus]
MPVPWREEEVVQMHHWNIVPKTTKIHKCCPEAERLAKKEINLGPTPITWTVSDIAKAARLLSTPPLKTNFEDEQEMRRVYTLIYDTFRYKGILNQALNDIAFYQLYPELQEVSTRVWLLFFDLYHRSFRKREPAVIDIVTKLFEQSGLTHAEDALWTQRVKLAAAVARLRIKNSALRLSELLPKHLRDERVSCQAQTCPVTCWINTNKVKSEEEIISTLEKSLKLKLLDKAKQLEPECYKWDTLCPNFISFHSSMRNSLAKSPLIQKHKLVVQDRSFCLGPATFGKIILDLELAGTVVQSHVNSPRTTAYLATLLSQNSKIKNLLVFGAGSRKEEYESYFQELGMTNVSIYSEKLIDIPPDSNCLERAIAVFATPPNSYSAVADPIDLVCSRGGDLSMLEILTESEITEEGKERVARILEEQRKTLKFAMSRPQIQVVLYETHSELEVENDAMVQKALKEINKLAKLKHAALQGKLRVPSSHSDLLMQEVKEINNNENIKLEIIASEDSVVSSASKRHSVASKVSVESGEMFDKMYKDVVVPNCDLFDKPQLPDLCPNSECCLKLQDEGCYLALLQRKEVIRLDNKYMIQMAEVRGLFGSNSNTSGRTKGSRGSKSKKQEKRPASPAPVKTKRKTKYIEFDRIAAPTLASLRHAYNSSSNGEVHNCPRHYREEDESLYKAMELLKNAAKGVRDIAREWEEYKRAALEKELEAAAEESDPEATTDCSESEDFQEDIFSLDILKNLTQSNDNLKDLISSRLPYKSIKHKFPSYGWKFFVERNNVMIDNPFDESLELSSDNSKCAGLRSRSDSRNSSSKQRKRHLSPAEIVERVSAPTYNSLTRNTIQIAGLSENHANARAITPECEVCKRRNVE